MPEPFTIDIAESEIRDLKRRLARTRWPSEVEGSGWQYGSNLGYIRELCEYWQHEFDWPAQQARLNEMPQFTTRVSADGVEDYTVHFVLQEGVGPDPLPLLFTHGWPGSFYEVSKIIGPLTDPAAHGGDPRDAFTIVAPSLPGYGFSEIPGTGGFGHMRTARLWAALMAELGYERYGVQGGDIGAGVSALTAHEDREHCIGLQSNMPNNRPPTDRPQESWSDDERAIIARVTRWMADEAAYQWIQGTRPQTLSYGLTDSPAGLAAWIVEKWRSWSDCSGDIESRFSKDEILTNISIYWFTRTMNSATRFYYERRQHPERNAFSGRLETPAGFSVFPKEIFGPHRSWVEAEYNVRQWSVHDRGGHFAALEEPELLVGDIREFFRPLR
ncbi:MAG: epoxide hydrolase [Chloroflexi bacterium]|nr:epoxide hydrolase [Chloroflexota bacterium]MYF80247.1 epoxide hydrolase [Chloroflexota bacterium]MYI03572.1 epoxide hydrolase [Chloroflexota bacterium]